MALFAPLMVGVVVPSDTSNMMAEGTFLKYLNSSTDIEATRLLTKGVSQGVPLLRSAWLVESSL